MKKFALVVAAIAFGAQTAAAQVAPVAPKSDTKGFMIGVRLAGSAVSVEGSDTESGGGGGLVVGFGLSQALMLFAAADYSLVESQDPTVEGNYGLAHVDIGVRANLGSTSSTLRPYVLAALTGRAAGGNMDVYADNGAYLGSGDYAFSGAGITAGAGLGIFVSPKAAFDIGLDWSFGSFDNFEFEGTSFDVGSLNANSARFTVGFNWLP